MLLGYVPNSLHSTSFYAMLIYCHSLQLSAEMDTLKQTIAGLTETIETAKEKQKVAKTECKKLEKDMDEFRSDKDGKLKEVKVSNYCLLEVLKLC